MTHGAKPEQQWVARVAEFVVPPDMLGREAQRELPSQPLIVVEPVAVDDPGNIELHN